MDAAEIAPPPVEAPSLMDVLARQWRFDAAVTACAFDAGERQVAFALADGRLAVAPVADPEPAAARRRAAVDSGRATIAPRRRPVPPLAPLAVGDGPIDLAAMGGDGFLAGGGGGVLVRVTGAGFCGPLETPPAGAVEAMTAIAGGDVAIAAGGSVLRCDGRSGAVRAIGGYRGVAAVLAVSPAGARLAVATGDELVLSTLDADTIAAADRLALTNIVTLTNIVALEGIVALAWAPDGRRLAAGLADGGVALVDAGGPHAAAVTARLGPYPAPVASLAWSRDGRRLATGGAFRTIVWDLEHVPLRSKRSERQEHARGFEAGAISDRPDDSIWSESALGAGGDAPPRAIETGAPRFLVTERVALHPRRPLAAAGLENGAVVVAAIGRRDELILKPPGDGAVRALAWSADGATIAFGTAGGLAAVVGLPPHLFK